MHTAAATAAAIPAESRHPRSAGSAAPVARISLISFSCRGRSRTTTTRSSTSRSRPSRSPSGFGDRRVEVDRALEAGRPRSSPCRCRARAAARPARPRQHRDRARACPWRTGSCPRADRPRYRPRVRPPALAGPADLLADEEHRRLVALALADHDRAVDIDGVELPAHRLDRGLIRCPVPLAHRLSTRDGRRLDDPQEIERKIGMNMALSVERDRTGAEDSGLSRSQLAVLPAPCLRRYCPVLSPQSWLLACSARGQLAAGRPVHAIPSSVVGLHQRVNLAAYLRKSRRPCVAIEPAHRIFIRVAVSSMHLHRVAGRALAGDGREPLGQARLTRVAPPHVLQPPSAQPEQPGSTGSPTPSARSSP